MVREENVAEAKVKDKIRLALTVERFEFYNEDMGVSYVSNENHECF